MTKQLNETADLIKVKTLSARYAKQIACAHSTGPTGRQIIRALQAGAIKPIAWASGRVLDGFPDHVKVWLVSFAGNLYWIVAPYDGNYDANSPEWLINACMNLEQIFIG